MPRAQPDHPISEKTNVTFQPPCPTCGLPMWLKRLSKFDEAHDLGTFECMVCTHVESRVVDFKAVL